jgi:hypothetical protein
MKFNDSDYTERYEDHILSGHREPKLMSAIWTPAECSVTKNTLDWSVESRPFMIGRQIQGFFMTGRQIQSFL